MDFINDVATQNPLGASKRHLPHSCAADFLGATPIGRDVKRRKKESVDRKTISPAQSRRRQYKNSESVVAKLAQHRPSTEYPVEALKTTSEPSVFPNLYTAALSATTTIPISVPPNQLSAAGTTTNLLAGAQSSPGNTFMQGQTLLSGQTTTDQGRDVTPRSNLANIAPVPNPAEEERQGLNRHLDPISSQTFAWASGPETLIPVAYGVGIFDTLNGHPVDTGSSRSLAYPAADIYPVQDPTRRQLSHESIGLLRFPEYALLEPWSQNQSISVLAQSSGEAQADMAITQSSFRVTVPVQTAMSLRQPLSNGDVEDNERTYDRSDAEYVIVSANPTLLGNQMTGSQPEQVEETPDVTSTQSAHAGLEVNTSPQVDPSWEIIVPGQDLDDDNLDDDGQPQPDSLDKAEVVGSLEDIDNSAAACKMPKRRQTFNEIDRQETSRTRNIGACLRCKMQRIRCKENPNDPEGPCLTCAMVSKTSKKVIHRVSCVRYKLQEITLYRTSGLGITKRWEGVTMRDVDFTDAPELDIRFIQMDQGLCSEPMAFRVRRFVPQPGDVLYRKWLDKNDQIHKMVELAPYALADIHETKDIFVKYIDNHAFECLHRFVSNSHTETLGNAQDVIRDTYTMALSHFQSLGDNPQHNDEKLFLANLFRFWFALRHTTGSSWIAGQERLGMIPVPDPSYPPPLRGKVSTPRMIIAQFDSINTQFVLRTLAKKLLEKLEKFMKTKNTNRYLTIFVSCFILLHEISHMTGDRWRHGRDNGVEGGYSLPSFVRELQESANVILFHWHYYKSGIDPLSMDWDQRAKTPLADLSQDEIMFLINTWQRMKDREETIRNMWNKGLHFHSLYFVAQMFEQKWSPKKTFAG